MILHHIVAAEMLPGLRLRLRFADGFAGVASLAGTVRQGGVFAAVAADPGRFSVTGNGRAVAWTDADGEAVEFCADALRQLAEASAAQAAE